MDIFKPETIHRFKLRNFKKEVPFMIQIKQDRFHDANFTEVNKNQHFYFYYEVTGESRYLPIQ